MNEESRKEIAIKLFEDVRQDNVDSIFMKNYYNYVNENEGIGFSINTLDVAKNQLKILKDLSFYDFKLQKQYESYLKEVEKWTNPEPIFDENKPLKYLDDLIDNYLNFKSNLFLNGKDRLKAFEMLDKHTSNRDILKPHLAIQQLKKLIKTTSFKDVAKCYLDKAKQVRNDIENLIEDLINKNILEPIDYNQFNIDVLRHLDTFIIEVEKLAGLNETLSQQIIEDTSNNLPEIELKTQKDQIRLLYDLGVIDFLQNKYEATLKNNNNQTAHLLAQILKLSKNSIQPTVNALLHDDPKSKNYPKESNDTKAIIDKLNSLESK